MVSIAQVVPDQIAELREMLREYLAWTRSFNDGSESAPTFESVDQELLELPGIFAPPPGRLLVATLDGKVAGCVALKPHDHEECELKRLYVRPEFRGHKLGQLLVTSLLNEARQSGYQRVVLDSHRSMIQAHKLYRDAGFVEISAPDDFPEYLRQIAIFMERDLSSLGRK